MSTLFNATIKVKNMPSVTRDLNSGGYYQKSFVKSTKINFVLLMSRSYRVVMFKGHDKDN